MSQKVSRQSRPINPQSDQAQKLSPAIQSKIAKLIPKIDVILASISKLIPLPLDFKWYVLGVIMAESSFNPNALRTIKEEYGSGLMQIGPATGIQIARMLREAVLNKNQTNVSSKNSEMLIKIHNLIFEISDTSRIPLSALKGGVHPDIEAIAKYDS
ncbi:MAG: transglycosylase SLT domain-containing protein, partial [Candidatus Margulisiibacteriota bacterium]